MYLYFPIFWHQLLQCPVQKLIWAKMRWGLVTVELFVWLPNALLVINGLFLHFPTPWELNCFSLLPPATPFYRTRRRKLIVFETSSALSNLVDISQSIHRVNWQTEEEKSRQTPHADPFTVFKQRKYKQDIKI